jgi:hypothetical protein
MCNRTVFGPGFESDACAEVEVTGADLSVVVCLYEGEGELRITRRDRIREIGLALVKLSGE